MFKKWWQAWSRPLDQQESKRSDDDAMTGDTSHYIIEPVRALHTPESSSESLIIIFFHGISFGNNDNYKKTWMTSKNDPECWPEKWLPADLGPENVRILSITYDLSVYGSMGNVTDIGRSLLDLLVISYKHLWRAPIVLVGHSFGGLVIKSLVVEVEKRSIRRRRQASDTEALESCKKFLDNLKGIVFYGVPHAGGTESYTKYFDKQFRKVFSGSKKDKEISGFRENLKPFDHHKEILSGDFMNALPDDIGIIAFIGGRDIFVPAASALRLSFKNHFKVEDADHETICMPVCREAPNYHKMLEMMKLIMDPVLQTHASSAQEASVMLQQQLRQDQSVPRLYRLPEGGRPLPTNHQLTVVFLHGLQTFAGARAWKDTWRQRDDVNCIWPGVWLLEDLGEEKVLVLSLSYDADATRWGDYGYTESVEQIGFNLVQNFVTESEWASVLKKPIVLVGHSFGGLVIKSLLVEADKQAKRLEKRRVPSGLALRNAEVCKMFRDNVKGIVFYGVPQSGSDIATMARLNDAAFKSLLLTGIMKNLEPFERKMEELTVDFREAVGEDIDICAFAEGRPTFGGSIVVPWASAVQGSGINNYKIEDANHMEICKPPSQSHISYSKLLSFLKIVVPMEDLHSQEQESVDISSPPSLSSSYFQRVEKAKVLVGTISRQVLLNEGQCEWLESRLREAVECAQDAFSTLPTQRFEQLLGNFYLKVKDVEILVGQCCAEPWLTNAILIAGSEEYFVLRGQELRWFQALFKHVKQGSESGLWQEGVPTLAMFEREEGDDMAVLLQDLEENAKEDRAKLRTNLEEVISKSASVADSDLARNLLNKLDLKSEQSRGVAEAAPHVLWKVDPKELGYGNRLGSGAGGAGVYETKWLKQPFARKVFHVSHETVFEQEAAILAGLQHPHILPMVCTVVDSARGTCSLVTELMSEDLESVILRNGSFSLHGALDLMLQVAEGMKFLHKKGVVHKDLKSSNILVRPVEDPNLASEGFVCAKVADFGLSKSKEESATRSQLTLNIGTTRWMAPELLEVTNADGTSYSLPNKELYYHFRVDVYSYAITFSEVLTGKSPYHNLFSNTEIKKKVMAEYLRPELPTTCPISLATLIVKCWDEDASQRPSFAKISKELRHIKGQMLMGVQPSFALEPLSKLYKIVAGEGPFMSSSWPEPLAAFMEIFRKKETRSSRQNICNALRHIQGLLFTEGITGTSSTV